MNISDLNLEKLNYKVVGDEIKLITDDKTKVVSKQLIYPSALITHLINETEKVELTYKVLDKWKTIIVDKEVISNKNKIISLANHGVYVTSSNNTLLVNYLNDVIIMNQAKIPKKKSVSHVGWINGNFIPYTGNIIFDGETSYKPYYEALVKSKGDYDLWKENISKFRENLIVRLIIDASFASVLLELTGSLPFVTLIYGKTGKGKTVTLQVAASVWGNPANDRLINSLDNTANFLYRTMGFYHSIPGFFDELQLYKEKQGKSRLVMCLAQGIDRGKADKDGGNKAKETWKNAALLTGEDSISDTNSGGGTLNRLIEINVDEFSNGNLFNDCAYASAIAQENYGFAGREFIDFINKMGKVKINEIYREKLEEVKALNKTAGKQASSMANILLADEILNMIMFKEKRLTAEDVKEFLFAKDEIDISERAYDYIMGEIAIHNSCFVDLNNKGDNNEEYKAKSKREFWGGIDSTEIFILKTQFEKILKAQGFNYNKTTKDWARSGYLIKNNNGRNVHQTTVATIRGDYIKLRKTDKETIKFEKEQSKNKAEHAKNVQTNHLNEMLNQKLEYDEYFEKVGG